MKDNQAKYPQLRFKDFTDPWEQHKLGSILSLLKDGTHGTHKDSLSGPYLLSAKNIKGGQVVIDDSDRKISQAEFNSIHKTFSLLRGDVLLTIVGSIGKSAVLQDPSGLTFQRSVAYMRPKTMDSFFLRDVLTTSAFQKDLVTHEVVSAQPGIYLGDLAKLTISFPPEITEQRKIADFFGHLDHLITLHQRKLAKLKKLKQGYLQKLFPQNGSKFPQLRFAGFADAWEQRKLGELGKIYTGNTPKTSDLDNWTDNKEGHIWITPTDIDKLIMSDSDRHLSEQGWSKARKIPENSVLITSIASIGKNTINAVPVAFNQQINAIVPEKNDSYFILSAMIKDTARFASVAGQTATAIINKTTFEKFQIATPSYEEQQKIGSFFKQLDNTITLHQRKLEKLQELKKGYLQKMFC